MREDLEKLLAQLHFKGMAESLARILATADAEALSALEVVYRLLLEEWRYRQERSLAYRLTQAKLPWDWSLETFPFERQPGVNAAQIKGLASLGFIPRAENLVFIGPPGTGKSGLALGLLRQALVNGYRARFYKAQELFDELYASLADRSTSRLLRRLSHYDLIQIDELGYLTLKPEQVNAFFKLMDMRYGRRPTLITTNLDYPDWYELFQRKPLVDALLDRLQHHCITIRIDGPSPRKPYRPARRPEPLRLPIPPACALVDESFGPARALRDVWTSHGQLPC
jgi:DNA replication protein DnaC